VDMLRARFRFLGDGMGSWSTRGYGGNCSFPMAVAPGGLVLGSRSQPLPSCFPGIQLGFLCPCPSMLSDGVHYNLNGTWSQRITSPLQ
jgi:hypothetical protein